MRQSAIFHQPISSSIVLTPLHSSSLCYFCFFTISSCYGNKVSVYFDLTETLWSVCSASMNQSGPNYRPGESDLLAAFSTIWIPLESHCRIEHENSLRGDEPFLFWRAVELAKIKGGGEGTFQAPVTSSHICNELTDLMWWEKEN